MSSILVLDIGSLYFRAGSPINPRPTTTSKSPLKLFSDSFWSELEEHLEAALVDNPETILLTTQMFPTKNCRAHVAQILFEKFNISHLNMSQAPVLNLLSDGKVSGLVVHSGFKESQVYPVYEGHVLDRSLSRGLEIAGEYLTRQVYNWLVKNHYNHDKIDLEVADKIKEDILCVQVNNNSEIIKDEENFVLPDGITVMSYKEKFKFAEELFQSFNEFGVIQEYVVSRIYKSDPTIRGLLYNNILLSGGNSLIKGFGERLRCEIILTMPQRDRNYEIKIIEPKNRDISTWIGGSVLSQLDNFKEKCMSDDDYKENGPYYVETKFF